MNVLSVSQQQMHCMSYRKLIAYSGTLKIPWDGIKNSSIRLQDSFMPREGRMHAIGLLFSFLRDFPSCYHVIIKSSAYFFFVIFCCVIYVVRVIFLFAGYNELVIVQFRIPLDVKKKSADKQRSHLHKKFNDLLSDVLCLYHERSPHCCHVVEADQN